MSIEKLLKDWKQELKNFNEWIEEYHYVSKHHPDIVHRDTLHDCILELEEAFHLSTQKVNEK